MGQARKAPAKRAKRGFQGGPDRGQRRTAAVRTDADADLSRGERPKPHADGAMLGHGGLADRAETNNPSQTARYEGLRLKAERALSVLIDAPGVPANVRSAAIRTALELVGAIGVRSKDQREEANDTLDPEHLTVEDIDREISKLGRV
jgi:hypothetical protein